MTVKTESNYLGDFLKYEAEAFYCREPVLAGNSIPYFPHNPKKRISTRIGLAERLWRCFQVFQ